MNFGSLVFELVVLGFLFKSDLKDRFLKLFLNLIEGFSVGEMFGVWFWLFMGLIYVVGFCCFMFVL